MLVNGLLLSTKAQSLENITWFGKKNTLNPLVYHEVPSKNGRWFPIKLWISKLGPIVVEDKLTMALLAELGGNKGYHGNQRNYKCYTVLSFRVHIY